MEISERAEKLLRSSEIRTQHDMLDELTAKVGESTQVAVAEEMGYSGRFLGDVLRGKRPVPGRMAERMGWKRVTVFAREASK